MRREFWWGNQTERDHYEDEDIGGRIILKLLLATGWTAEGSEFESRIFYSPRRPDQL
jgi:hypothetical protein